MRAKPGEGPKCQICLIIIIIQKSRDAASGSIPADRSEYNQIITIAGHAVTV